MKNREALKSVQTAIRALSGASLSLVDGDPNQMSLSEHLVAEGSIMFLPGGVVCFVPPDLGSGKYEMASWPRDPHASTCMICKRTV